MSQNRQVFRHMTDIFVFRNYLDPSISNTFQTSWTHFRHLPDGLKTFQTPSRHLPDTFESPTRNFKNFRHLTDIQNMIILLNHFRHFCETYQTHWIPSRHLPDTKKLSKYLLDMVKPIATFAFVVAVP